MMSKFMLSLLVVVTSRSLLIMAKESVEYNLGDTAAAAADDSLNVFDWFFGDPQDEDNQEHELKEHFGYLRGGQNADADLAKLAETIGIKPEFFSFKAHDYDDNDRIDGLELLAMFVNEKSHHHPHQQPSGTGAEINDKRKLMEMCIKTIDLLFQQEDVNNDGYLDFMEFHRARQRIGAMRKPKTAAK